MKKKAVISDRKKKIDKKLNHAKVSTGSMGTYKGQTGVLDKKTKKIKHKTMPDLKNIKEEKRRSEDVLRRVFGK